MSGGFVDRPDGSTSQNQPVDGGLKGLQPLLSLTSRQEAKLRVHLDDRLLSLERDERKQAFISIPDLLSRLYPLLYLILQIPARAPWSNLRIDYLLTFTGSISTYITSLPLLSTAAVRGNKTVEEAEKVVWAVLGFLDEIERGWLAVLAGQGWVMDYTPEDKDVKEAQQDGGDELSRSERAKGRGVHVDFAGSVGQTERTRLRSIIIASRAKFLAWARTYGSFPGQTLTNPPHTPASSRENYTTTSNPKATGRTMGCGTDFDPDPPTSYASTADGNAGRIGVRRNGSSAGGWEDEILGMWNTLLEKLSDEDIVQADGRGQSEL